MSARSGEGLDLLLKAIEDSLPDYLSVKLLLPFSEAGLAERIRLHGAVESEEYTPEGCRLTARVPHSLASAVRDYIIE